MQVLLELSHDGLHFSSEKIMHYETGYEVIMNFDVFSNNKYSYLVVSEEGNCRLYKLKYQFSKVQSNSGGKGSLHYDTTITIQFSIYCFLLLISDISTSNGIRNRKSKPHQSSSNSTNGVYDKKLSFQLVPGANVQSDFS